MRGKPPFIYGDGKQKRAFSYIDDVTPCLANVAYRDETNDEIINLGSNEVVTINEACKIVLEVMNSNLEPIYMERRPGEVKFAYCTTEKSEKLLNYVSKNKLREGVFKMVKWAKNNGPTEPTYTFSLEIKKRAPKVWLEKLIFELS